MPTKKVGEIAVDSGTILVLDPSSWKDLKVKNPALMPVGQNKNKIYNVNVAVLSRCDDGTYPVYETYDKNKQLTKITIKIEHNNWK
jgi:hypothetical protein